MAAEIQDIFDIYYPTLNVGGKIGFLPTAAFKNSEQKDEDRKGNFSFYSTMTAFIRGLFHTVFLTYFAFTICMGFQCTFATLCSSATLAMKITLSGWMLTALFSFASILIHFCKSTGSAGFLDKFRRMQSKIINDNLNLTTKGWSVKEFLAREKNIYNVSFFFELGSIVTITVFVGLNVNLSPRAPAFLYALVPPEIEIPWLRNLSLGFQIWYTLLLGGVRLVTQVYKGLMYRGFTLCGRIISTTPDEVVSADIGTSIKCATNMRTCIQDIILPPVNCTNRAGNFEEAVTCYKEMRTTMKSYNELFSKSLVCFKAISLILTTVLLYAALNDQVQQPKAGLLVFYTASILHCIMVYRTLYFMGQFYPITSEFRSKWRRYLAWNGLLTERNKALLHTCDSFGFEVGNFYTMKPSTLFTFYSILLSYVILVFQL
ncbi:unnamed protein product [Allacma fusca]|uniref:Uncharacterized protein n=1 Tax=Allacma fusca TaxID=39272 RepID=A0A8J2PYR2_9HEXA|nr:unnamed protein product [Allacma fusca]